MNIFLKILSVLIIAFYMVTVVSFIGIEKTWASWAMVVIIPVGWGLKAAVIVFNSRGREKVFTYGISRDYMI